VNQIAMNVAEQGGKVLVYSLEMGPPEVVKRCLSNMSGIDLFHLQRPLNQGEIDGLELMRTKMTQWSFTVSKAQKCDINALCAEARQIKQLKGLDLLVVDYIQLLTSPAPRNMQQTRATEIDTIARRLKMLAQELDCVVLAASQLNSEGKFRESRGIEQNASTGFVCGPVENEEGVLAIELQKQRHGERGSKMRFKWHKPTFTVSDFQTWIREEVIFS
jgi:replicative DNA helicase